MPRFAQIRQAFLSLVVLGTIFGAYSLCVVPFVEPAGREDVAEMAEAQFTDASRSTDRYVRELSPLFPAGSWELNQPKVLHTEQATILLQEFEQLQDGSLHVKPCTLVFFGNKPDKDDTGPTIMQAPDGAILAFDEPLDISSGSFGKPVAGRLVGPIRIFRAGGENADDLELVTSNVEISNRRVWTREQVSFRLGNTYGSGSELQLTRSESDEDEPTDADSHKLIDDLGTIELQRLDRLSFRVEDGDFFEPGTLMQSPQRKSPPQPTQVEVRSDGPMHFDLKLMIATIEDNVTISRQEQNERPDMLRASRLSMHFKRNQKPKTATTAPGAKKESSIELTRLIADGNPLVIDAKSKNAYVESKHLEYDFGTREIKLRGGLINYEGVIPGQPKQQKSVQVKLRGPTYQIVAPSVEFENKGGTQWSMLAAGAGQFVGSPDGREQMQATWTRGMRMTPAEGRHILRIDGNASVQAPGIGSIGASGIEVWLREESKRTGTRIDGTPVFEKKPTPERLITESRTGERTQINSPQFRGSLERMEIRFESHPHPVRQKTAATKGFVRPFERPTQVPLADDKPKSTYRIEGGNLTAWVDPETQEVSRMTVRGQSRIIEDSPTQRPFELQGTAIDMALMDGVPVATISGTPAVMRSAELDVVGNTIEFDGSRNDIHIPGAGTLKVQATADLWGQSKKPASNALANANVPLQPKKATPIDIEWQQGLHFDGEVVSVSGNVRAVGEDLMFSANDVSITLDRIVDLSNLDSGAVRPELKFMSARGRVEAAVGSRNDAGEVESYQRIVARDLDVDFATGDVEASGPGRLSFTTAKPLLPAMGPIPQQARQADPASADNSSASELSHLSIAFRTKIKGNQQRREAHLFDNIRMWFGPAGNWEDVADPQQRGQLREKDVWMSCSELFVLESPTAVPGPDRKPIELLARGDAYVEGQLYAAKGHQIKYAEDKDMLTFEGDAQRPAELWQRKSVGDQATSSGRVRRIRYWPTSEQFELDGLIGIDVSSAPTNSNR